MKIIKAMVITIVMTVAFTAVMYTIKSKRMVLVAAENSAQVDNSAPDKHMCERLIRFGQAAFDRGRITEAKHFFQKAIAVAPNNPMAWKKYNMALLTLVTMKVGNDPEYLPKFSTDSGMNETDSPSPASNTTNVTDTEDEEDDDGC